MPRCVLFIVSSSISPNQHCFFHRPCRALARSYGVVALRVAAAPFAIASSDAHPPLPLSLHRLAAMHVVSPSASTFFHVRRRLFAFLPVPRVGYPPSTDRDGHYAPLLFPFPRLTLSCAEHPSASHWAATCPRISPFRVCAAAASLRRLARLPHPLTCGACITFVAQHAKGREREGGEKDWARRKWRGNRVNPIPTGRHTSWTEDHTNKTKKER